MAMTPEQAEKRERGRERPSRVLVLDPAMLERLNGLEQISIPESEAKRLEAEGKVKILWTAPSGEYETKAVRPLTVKDFRGEKE
jgi:hypothetical protein